jgi:D-3-phosphoglycerate dehydrogenase
MSVAIFDAAPRVRAVTIHGTGTDLVPLESATAHDVLVARLPGANAQSVAEYCVMAMLLLARNQPAVSAAMRTDAWDDARALGEDAHEIAEMTLGLVGVGEIGKRVAKICRQGFGMRVLGHQRRLDRLRPDAAPATLDALLAESDFVVVTCPLTPETKQLFNQRRFSQMKRTSWLINVGRGPVVEEAALIDALREKRIAGAMLDVYEHYRIAPGHPLFALDNVILTPHLAGMTRESRVRMGVRAAEETLRMLAGEKPKNFVNPQAWDMANARRAAQAVVAG